MKESSIRKSIDILLARKGWNATRLAIEAGISGTNISRYRNGYDIRLSTVVKLCRALNVSVSEFFAEGETDE